LRSSPLFDRRDTLLCSLTRRLVFLDRIRLSFITFAIFLFSVLLIPARPTLNRGVLHLYAVGRLARPRLGRPWRGRRQRRRGDEGDGAGGESHNFPPTNAAARVVEKIHGPPNSKTCKYIHTCCLYPPTDLPSTLLVHTPLAPRATSGDAPSSSTLVLVSSNMTCSTFDFLSWASFSFSWVLALTRSPTGAHERRMGGG
jgi:hypothetical protein